MRQSSSDKGERARFRSTFGAALDAQLQKAGINQAALASKLGTSRSYLNQTMTGAKSASPQWADFVSDVLALSPKDRVRLHAAAAQTAGYRLDLVDVDRAPKRKKRPGPG